jgi:hypothetical protein
MRLHLRNTFFGILVLVALFLTLFVFPVAAQKKVNSAASVPFVPPEVLSAKTIAVSVYWPDAGWRDKAEVQGDGEAFLRRWKRYKVVRISESPDLIALVTVEPTSDSGGFWKKLAYALAVGAQAYAMSAQNYEQCHGQTSGGQVDITCHGYASSPASAPPPPPGPSYVLGGTIMVFNGTFLRTGTPIPEPLMFAEADNRGSMPLIGAAKRMRQMVEQAAKVLPERMAAVNVLIAKVHELAVAHGLPKSEEPACSDKIAQQIHNSSEMLDRLERGDVSDVQKLFQEVCATPGNH